MNIRFILLIGFLGSYLFISPYITVNRMLGATNDHDAEKLIRYIDFPAVRDSVKDQLKKLLKLDMPRDLQKVILLAISAPQPKTLEVEEMIDLVITDKSLRALLVNMKNKEAGLDRLLSEVTMGWHGFNEYTVTVKRGREVKFILTRDKLIFWKLTKVVLPIDQIYLQRRI